MANRKKTLSTTKTASSVVKQLGVSAAFLMASTQVGALGLGAFEVQSNLDQPLNGTIELRTAPNDDVSTVRAVIASREDFESLGIDYPGYLENISLSIEDSGGGKILRVVSNDVVIKEPFIHFLVRVDWSGGSFLREYTALIDPPVYAAEAPRSFAEPRAVGTDQSYESEPPSDIDVEPLEEEAVEVEEPVEEAYEPEVQTDEVTTEPEEETLIEDDFYESPEQETAVDTGTERRPDARYGPVTRGESLSVIAQELQRQFPDLSIYQIMKVLFDENEGAFIQGNINGLIEGAILDIGDLDAIRAVDLEESREFYRTQLADWDPSFLQPAGSDSLNVGQDEYAFTDDTFGSTTDTGASAGVDSFQVGASTETESFVSSDQGANREGEILALRQEIAQLETSLASSELENQELTERISSLEGQLADMNRLMSLNVENAEMAEVEATLAQQNAADDTTAESDTSAIDEFLNAEPEEPVSDEAIETALEEFTADLEETAAETVDDGSSAVDEFLNTGDDTIADTTGDDLGEFAATDTTTDTDTGLESVIEEADTTVDTPAETPAPVVQTEPEKSLLEKASSMFFEGGLWKILAGVGVLLVAGLAMVFLRRRRADEEFEISMLSIESNSQSIDTIQSETHSASMSQSVASVATIDADAAPDKETSFLTVYSDSDAVVQADEVDPVAEADVYIAYGRDEQAEEVLLDGIAGNPERVDIKHKLLGLYHKTENSEGFERVAEELYAQRELLSNELWSEVVEMGKELVPDNPLFDLSTDDLSTAHSSMSIDIGADAAEGGDIATDDLETGLDDIPMAGLDDDGNLAADGEAVEDQSELVVESLTDDNSIHLINFDDGRSEISELDEVEIDALDPATSDQAEEVIDFSDEALDAMTESLADDAPAAPVEEVAVDDDDGDLDFDSELSADNDEIEDTRERTVSEVQEVSDLEIDPDYDEARTQYELAKVFVDLGDEDGARKILNELVANDSNDESVLNDARELLESINS